jgi:hypothetical protein
MLERDPHPEIGGQTQRSNHLGGPNLLDGLRYGLPHLENSSSVARTGRRPTRLVREPNNEYHSNAIAVYAANPKTGAAVRVGHINRESCLTMAPILDTKNGEGEQVGLVGRIRGGWDRGDGDTGHYGIWLVYDPADFR